jgi:hypothetical protein
MAQAIIARAGGVGSIYRYIGPGPAWTHVPFTGADGSNQNIVLIFNWVDESDAPATGPNWNYAQAAGDALYAALRDPVFANFPATPPASLIADRALHFIGHSRGACVCSEAIIRLARDGITVDHLTTLDPHPVNGTLDPPLNFDWNDPTPARWSNITFADNYYRADGGGLNAFDFDGIPINGAFNTLLSESALNCSGCGYSQAHSDTHLWHHGTIDLSPTPCDGEACITQQMRETWWPQGYTQRGYYYSLIGGGIQERPAMGPASLPPVPAIIALGDFDNASHAGWSYHGGSVGGSIVNEGGATFLKIGAGIGSGGPMGRHNRFFLPGGGVAKIELDSRVLAGANTAGELLRLTLIDQAGVETVIADAPIATTPDANWVLDRQFTIPAGLPRDRAYALALSIVPAGAGTPTAVIGLDNIDVSIALSLPGDVNGDGSVDVDDLIAVILAWGACPAPPIECPADLNNSGSVDVDDLIAVILNWG